MTYPLDMDPELTSWADRADPPAHPSPVDLEHALAALET